MVQAIGQSQASLCEICFEQNNNMTDFFEYFRKCSNSERR